MEVLSFDYKEKSLNITTLFDNTCEVQVDYFWDSHGKLIPWKTSKEFPKYRKSAKVLIQEEEYEWSIGGNEWHTETRLILFIDGVRIGGEPYRFSGTDSMIRVKVIVGSG